MKRIYTIISAAVVLFAGCEEFQPVFTGKYPEPPVKEVEVLEPTHTIAELAKMYTVQGEPVEIEEDIIIAGKVTTTDQPGNFYKSLYIQDETCGMEIKIGRNGLYNEYKLGQTIYVKCNGLTIGMYGYKEGEEYGGTGMVQVGYVDPTKEYETSYMEHPLIVERHIVKGPYGDPVEPVVLTVDQLPGKWDCQKGNKYVGKYVTLKGLKYADEIFVLLYLDSNKDKKAAYNRVFLSDTNGVEDGDKTHKITTWAMSEAKMKEYLYAGYWDTCKVGSGSDFLMDENGNNVTLGTLKGDGTYPGVEKAAYAVSQYFTLGDKEVMIRTSGYCKFSDTEIDPAVLSGEATIDVTGVLTMYQGDVQFVINDLNGIVVNK